MILGLLDTYSALALMRMYVSLKNFPIVINNFTADALLIANNVTRVLLLLQQARCVFYC